MVAFLDYYHILICVFFQCILHPFIGLAAHIDKHITGGNLDDVIRRRLVAVQVNAIVMFEKQKLHKRI